MVSLYFILFFFTVTITASVIQILFSVWQEKQVKKKMPALVLAMLPNVQSQRGSNIKSLTLTRLVERRRLTSSNVWWRGNLVVCQPLIILGQWRDDFKLVFFFLIIFKMKSILKQEKKEGGCMDICWLVATESFYSTISQLSQAAQPALQSSLQLKRTLCGG